MDIVTYARELIYDDRILELYHLYRSLKYDKTSQRYIMRHMKPKLPYRLMQTLNVNKVHTFARMYEENKGTWAYRKYLAIMNKYGWDPTCALSHMLSKEWNITGLTVKEGAIVLSTNKEDLIQITPTTLRNADPLIFRFINSVKI